MRRKGRRREKRREELRREMERLGKALAIAANVRGNDRQLQRLGMAVYLLADGVLRPSAWTREVVDFAMRLPLAPEEPDWGALLGSVVERVNARGGEA